MKLRLFLVCSALALVAGVTDLARAAVPPKTCSQFCATVRCAYPTTCGPYINASGQPACGCH